MSSVEKRRLETDRGEIEIYVGGGAESALTVCAAHPAEAFGEGAVELLAAASGAQVVCASPRSLALEGMVSDLEALRWELGLDQWVFWGMSGGGWLAQIYARRYPDALAGIIVEGACA
ncbi:MAG TPA: alpha/beta hydrolase, partial [Thermoanaerobaculia bacterium]